MQGMELLRSVIRHSTLSLSPCQAEQNRGWLTLSLFFWVFPSGKWNDVTFSPYVSPLPIHPEAEATRFTPAEDGTQPISSPSHFLTLQSHSPKAQCLCSFKP